MLGIGRYTYLLCIQYFAYLIFVGNGHRRKNFNGENFPIYGSTLSGSLHVDLYVTVPGRNRRVIRTSDKKLSVLGDISVL